jgi:hypothetical protein
MEVEDRPGIQYTVVVVDPTFYASPWMAEAETGVSLLKCVGAGARVIHLAAAFIVGPEVQAAIYHRMRSKGATCLVRRDRWILPKGVGRRSLMPQACLSMLLYAKPHIERRRGRWLVFDSAERPMASPRHLLLPRVGRAQRAVEGRRARPRCSAVVRCSAQTIRPPGT